MAAKYTLVFLFLAVTLFEEVFGVNDKEFQDLRNMIHKTVMLRRQESVNNQQANTIFQQWIRRLQEDLMTNKQDSEPEDKKTDTIAFNSVLTSYSKIPKGSTLIFNEVLLNMGEGYDSSTGVFTVPPGGDGVYHLSMYLLVQQGEYGWFNMRLNNDVICSTNPDHSENGDNDLAPGSCSAVVHIVAGDEVQVVSRESTDDTPLLTHRSRTLFNGFNGFRI